MGIAERRQREKQQRYEEILAAARKIFGEKDFQAATMEDIAREAEVSAATLYLYFKNKDELFASLNIASLQYLLDRLRKTDERPGLSPADKLGELREILHDVYEFDPTMVVNVFHLHASQRLAGLSPPLLNQIQELVLASQSILRRLYDEGVAAGQFVEASSVAFADIIWGIFFGVALWEESKRVMSPHKHYVKETFQLAADMMLRGIRKT